MEPEIVDLSSVNSSECGEVDEQYEKLHSKSELEEDVSESDLEKYLSKDITDTKKYTSLEESENDHDKEEDISKEEPYEGDSDKDEDISKEDSDKEEDISKDESSSDSSDSDDYGRIIEGVNSDGKKIKLLITSDDTHKMPSYIKQVINSIEEN